MRQLGYAEIFWTLLSIEWALFGIAFGCVFLCVWISLRVVARMAPGGGTAIEGEWISGGHAVFLLVEKILGRPVPLRIQNAVAMVGWVLMLSLFLALTWNDIERVLSNRWWAARVASDQ